MQAKKIISLGFSLPRSDLHISSLLHQVTTFRNFSPKSIGLVYKEQQGDSTIKNWEKIFGKGSVTVLGRTEFLQKLQKILKLFSIKL